MDLSLSIADSSLNAQRTALAVTAENIANAQTAGYVSQTPQIETTAGDTSGIGTGVEVATISQASNALLTANNLQAQGALSNLTAASQVLSGIENVFPLGQNSSASSTGGTNTSIAGQLANFWSAWDAIAQNPSASAARTQIVNQAQGLVSSLNEASTQLGQIGQNSTAELQSQVTQVNTLLAQAATLNGDIVTTKGGGGNPDQLQDQLNQTVNKLASLVGVNVQTQSNGTALITAGGVALVQGTNAMTIGSQTVGGTTSITAQGGTVPVAVSSGSLAGLLNGLNQYLPQYQASIDAVANSLVSTVNGQLAKGYTATGVSGSGYPLFTGTGAGGIAVNQAIVTNPSLIAAASSSGAAGANDGSNAQAMAELGTSLTGPDANYQTLIQDIGSANQSITTQVSAQTSVANQAAAALSSVTGVNEDTELTNMMSYQQTYEASAKLLSTIDQTVQSLLAAV